MNETELNTDPADYFQENEYLWDHVLPSYTPTEHRNDDPAAYS